MTGRRRNSSHPAVWELAASLTIVSLLSAASHAVPLTIANPSFESPAYPDGGFDFTLTPEAQGTWGWGISDGGFIYNPPAADYVGAGGQGSPSNVEGAQVGGLFGFGEYVIVQTLAGPDAMPGTGDDPLVEPGAIYTLTFAIGNRAIGNTYGATWGGYDVQLRAGSVFGQILLGQETDVVTPPPGTFVTRTIVIETPTIAHPEAIGLPVTILLRKTMMTSTATTDFDNVRLDASKVSPPLNANFNETGLVDGADLGLWKSNYGAAGVNATHGHGNANGDDYVNGGDFLIWQRQLGSAGIQSVPEPAAGALALLAVLATAKFRRGNR